MNIYVASSWRNPFYKDVTSFLSEFGHTILEKRPKNEWTGEDYRDKVLTHPRAIEGFKNDFDLMHRADCCVLLLPCGRSAHLEAGWFAGRGKRVFIYIPVFDEPELMYKMANGIFFKLEELAEALQ